MAKRQTYLGIEIGGTKLQLALGDKRATQLRSWRWEVDRAQGGAGIRAQIEANLGKIIAESAPHAIGVGFGGPVDISSGKIAKSFQIEGWAGFKLRDWLAGQGRVPVFVDNDANVAALAEARHGAGRGFNPVFYVTLGSGVGGGLVVDNRIYHGALPGEAEFGHLLLNRHGDDIEACCSGWAVDAKVRARAAENANGVLSRLIRSTPPGGGEARVLQEALRQGDAAAEEILAETAANLAFGLSHVVHLFHPEVIVLGGGLSLIGEPLRAAVARELPKYVTNAFAGGPSVVLAALAENVVLAGALELARSGADGAIPFKS